ncbi:hypothetical protein ACUW90_002506 [Staphylococcus simulans]
MIDIIESADITADKEAALTSYIADANNTTEAAAQSQVDSLNLDIIII